MLSYPRGHRDNPFSSNPNSRMKLPQHPLYKTRMCEKYQRLGWCPYGKKCQFAHHPKEMPLWARSRAMPPPLGESWDVLVPPVAAVETGTECPRGDCLVLQSAVVRSETPQDGGENPENLLTSEFADSILKTIGIL